LIRILYPLAFKKMMRLTLGKMSAANLAAGLTVGKSGADRQKADYLQGRQNVLMNNSPQ